MLKSLIEICWWLIDLGRASTTSLSKIHINYTSLFWKLHGSGGITWHLKAKFTLKHVTNRHILSFQNIWHFSTLIRVILRIAILGINPIKVLDVNIDLITSNIPTAFWNAIASCMIHASAVIRSRVNSLQHWPSHINTYPLFLDQIWKLLFEANTHSNVSLCKIQSLILNGLKLFLY